MAFISRLPKRDMYLQEGQYGSKLHLRLNPITQCCDGTYEPLSDAPESDENAGTDLPGDMEQQNSVKSSTGTPGHAVLFGRIESNASSELVLKGEWRHVTGPLRGGSFEMKLDDEGTASGWWAKEGENETCPWQWTPSEDQPLKDTDADEHIVQTAAPRLRPSLSSRIGRGSTFFDEMLDAEGKSAVWIARWGVFCAWIFFYQTLAALFMSSFQASGTASSILQCGFQAVYTATYASFLVIYSRMRVMPPLDYVAGVVLYTIGYACFLVLYALTLFMEDEDVVAQASQMLYLVGSLFFLAGSAVLVRATLPPPVPMLFRKLTWYEVMTKKYSMIDQQSSLFWGSMTFLLGSVLFSLDAGWGLLNADSKPELLGMVCICAGYGFFTVGRVYFLWGSCTADCDAVFRGGGWGYKWCTRFLPSKASLSCMFAKCNTAKVAPDMGNSSQASLSKIKTVDSADMFNVMSMTSDIESPAESLDRQPSGL